MNLSEITSHLSGLGPLLGVAGGVVGVVSWLMRAYIGHLNKNITKLQKRVRELEDEKANLQKDLENEKKRPALELDAERARRVHAEDQRLTAYTARDVAEAKLNEEKLRSGELNKQVAKLSEQAVKWSDAYKAVEADRNRYRKERDESRQKLADAETRIGELGNDIAGKAHRIQELVQQIVQLKAVNDGVEVALVAETERLTKTRKLLHDTRRQVNVVVKQKGKVWIAPVRPGVPPFIPAAERNTRIISVLNLKGGVGKTTITANLAGYFAESKKRVLVIDLDHQRSLSQLLLPIEMRRTLLAMGKSVQGFFTATDKDGKTLLANAESVAGLPGCQLIVNHDPVKQDDKRPDLVSLEELEMSLMAEWLLRKSKVPDPRFLLRGGLHTATVCEGYDYVLLDCPPRLSTACVNALTSSDYVLVPVQAEPVSALSLVHMARRMAYLGKRLTPHLRGIGVVANMVPTNVTPNSTESNMITQIVKDINDEIENAGLFQLYNSMIPLRAHYKTATQKMQISNELKLAIDSKPVWADFEALAHELEEHVRECGRPAGVPA